MNVAGKSLQDIYDAGSKRLEDLENAQKASLKETTDAHLDNRAHVEPESLKTLEDRTAELEQELRTYLTRGLDRVEKALSAETQESERHINRLVESLVLLSRKFSESISKMRINSESQLQDLCDDSEQIYRAHAQTANSHVQHAGAEALGNLRTEGKAAHDSIAATVDSSWQSVFEIESEAGDGLLECFDNDREAVKKSVDDSKNALTERVDERTLKLEARSAQALENVRSAVESVIENSERYAFDVDVRLKEGFSSLLYEMTSSFDDSAKIATNEMTSLHESSMADLTMKSQDLSREMDALAQDVTTNASNKSDELQQKGNDCVKNLTDDLGSRLKTSSDFRNELESERKQMISEIWQELTDLRVKFESKLNDLAQKTLHNMRTVCDEAEESIMAAQAHCRDESKTNCGNKEQAIDTVAKEFLARIEATRKAALDSIAKAAGADGDETASLPDFSVDGKHEAHGEAESAKPDNSAHAPDGATSEATDASQAEGSQSQLTAAEQAASGEPKKRRKKGKQQNRTSGDGN